MAKIVYVSGGRRSGKSDFAQNMALQLSDKPIYLATSRVWDSNHKERIDRHIEQRGDLWITYEEQREISRCCFNRGDVVVIDCVTLWATNFFYDLDSNIDLSYRLMKEQIELMISIEATFIFVSNEIGLGGISSDEIQSKFCDLQGMINKFIAQVSSEAFLIVSGLPIKLK